MRNRECSMQVERISSGNLHHWTHLAKIETRRCFHVQDKVLAILQIFALQKGELEADVPQEDYYLDAELQKAVDRWHMYWVEDPGSFFHQECWLDGHIFSWNLEVWFLIFGTFVILSPTLSSVPPFSWHHQKWCELPICNHQKIFLVQSHIQ